ncbi:DUF3950 domain-containing protein [Xenorhabdus sp. XENO-10]|uniref:DUF3950 domain-containing protein n=1 Tax=Xenorhabdus yunnanensis TaxID=3025878 RepID=A0ABT5LH85_9GAMM|nr:YlcI/YnfO family protein [Xenorhabdus yunnanensis]MDC9590464.1 DUF3950 domain-containing protein [Xenorhabdus yunnanensis]
MQDEKSKKSYERNNSTRRTIRFEDDLLEQIEEIADKGNFSSWVKDACREKLLTLGIKPKI